MGKVKISFGCALILLVAGLVCTWPARAMAQATEPPEAGATDPQPGEVDGDDASTPSTANPPGYIGELLKIGDLQQEQVDQMRADGWGWGEIRLATRLAQQMVADSTEGLLFEDALAQVRAARAEGEGFGQIAAENNLKIGQLVGQRKAGDAQNGSAAQVRDRARTGDGDEPIGPDPANPPAYIREMVQNQVLTQEQVNAMLGDGWGWGEIRIATRLAQQMVANNTEGLLFEDALAQVRAAWAEGKGFGQIAAENNLKVGDLVGQRKLGGTQSVSAAQGGKKAQAGAAGGKKLGFFARVGRFLGFGRSADKPEHPVRTERTVRAERPERPERPARLERPERPERPYRPERSGGPHR
jgi:hypothetical protein